jgi:tRNA1(Val) A37 N6-methylase TrmN6
MTAERPEVTDDAILNGRLRLYQPKRGHRFGHDAILLAAATPARGADRVAELGAGVGAASLALLARVPGIDITLIEIDPALAALASDNIARNGFAERARTVTLDVAAPERTFDEAGLPASSLDCVLMNPPFNDITLQPSPDPGRRAAHVATEDTLDVWLRRAQQLLKPDGSVTLIWRADRQQDVLERIASAFGETVVLPVCPAPSQPPIRILVTARKSAAKSLNILPALTLADDHRRPSAEAEAVLRGGLPLPTGDPTRSAARAALPSTTDAQTP